MADLRKEIEKRRTFAIISHPDAGKTTLTEKFLLYGGAINLAGSVKGKATARHAVSDWMEIEKERGISVTSSVLQFNYDGYCINILDTPGHQDFSEDTYRTLMAADSAVMVIDGSKGVEAQTRKLFKVCVMRHIPIFTFINKMDRDANDTFDLLDEIENELGIATCPINWPIGSGKGFRGVYDRNTREVMTFADTLKGTKEGTENHSDLIIIDTAGRLQNKKSLMDELKKITKVIKKENSNPIESFLVIDATTGQNGVSQATAFKELTDITGIVITKMDGTSKGGIILAIRQELGIPVRFIGLGEKMDDLEEFDLDKYLYGLCSGLIKNEEN